MPQNNTEPLSTYAYLFSGLQDRASIFENGFLLQVNKQYQLFDDPDEDRFSRTTAAQNAGDALKERLEMFARLDHFQQISANITGNNDESNDLFTITLSESPSKMGEESLQQLDNFFPGLSQSFVLPASTEEESALREINALVAIHLQNKLRPMYALKDGATQTAYSIRSIRY